MEQICKLAQHVGRLERCPEDGCPFWEPGGAVLAGRCAFDHLDLDARKGVAAELLNLRQVLEAAQTEAEDRRVRREFYRLLNDGD
jgi:hypothetical protein